MVKQIVDGEEVAEEDAKKEEEIPYTLVDNDNGSYTVKYKIEQEMENIKINIFYKN